MRPTHRSAFLFALTIVAVAGVADADPPRVGVSVVHPTITGAALSTNARYTPASHEVAFQLTGTGAGTCGAQAVFTRREDALQTTMTLGPLTLSITVGSAFPSPFGLGPGTHSITINGVALPAQHFPACGGSIALAPLKVDESILGQTTRRSPAPSGKARRPTAASKVCTTSTALTRSST